MPNAAEMIGGGGITMSVIQAVILNRSASNVFFSHRPALSPTSAANADIAPRSFLRDGRWKVLDGVRVTIEGFIEKKVCDAIPSTQ